MISGSHAFIFVTLTTAALEAQSPTQGTLKCIKSEITSPPEVTFSCDFNVSSKGVTEIQWWYIPEISPPGKVSHLSLYTWVASTGEGKRSPNDRLMHGRLNISVDMKLGRVSLNIRRPLLVDSGVYSCQVVYLSHTEKSSVKYICPKIDIASINCNSTKPETGSTGNISCVYSPTYATPSFIKWHHGTDTSRNRISTFSFYTLEEFFYDNVPSLRDRVSYDWDWRTGRTTILIHNATTSDSGEYLVEMLAGTTQPSSSVQFSVFPRDLEHLTTTAFLDDTGMANLTCTYHPPDIPVKQLSWFSLGCDEEKLMYNYVIDKQVQETRSDDAPPAGLNHVFTQHAGQSTIVFNISGTTHFLYRCSVWSSRRSLFSDVSLQHIGETSQAQKLIVNVWPEKVVGSVAMETCRKMCAAVPDISTSSVSEHVVRVMSELRWQSVWVTNGTQSTKYTPEGQMLSRCRLAHLEANQIRSTETACSETGRLLCVTFVDNADESRQTKGMPTKQQEDPRTREVLTLVLLVIFVLLSLGLSVIAYKWGSDRPWLNRSEQFRHPSLNRHTAGKPRAGGRGDPLLETVPDEMYTSWTGQRISEINDKTVEMLERNDSKQVVVIGILSSGFELEHPCFRGPLPHPDYHMAVNGTHGVDPFGQGTFLAGVIIEICKKVKKHIRFVNLQAVNKNGVITRKSVESCLLFCKNERPPDILLIPNCFTDEFSKYVREMLESLMVKTVVVISASNDVTPPKDMLHLGFLAKLIIGSHDEKNEKCSDSPDYVGVDFLAPGSAVVSANAGPVTSQHVTGSGTAVAAAWVCGILVHVILQGKCLEQKEDLSVEYTTWFMHNVLLGMLSAEETIRQSGVGFGPLKPSKVLLEEDKLLRILKAASKTNPRHVTSPV